MYSVIIPAYNAAQYIRDCIQSVLNQTMDDYEVIVVDDASTDETAFIVQLMANENSKIRLVSHEENKGELLARKKGVEVAKGEYCFFLDQDDTLINTALENVTAILAEKDYDIISFGVRIFSESGVDDNHLQAAYSYFVPYQGELTGKQIFLECFEKQSYSHNVWDKVYKTSLCREGFSHITEKCIAVCVDLYTYFVISFLAEKFVGIEEKLYEYHVGRGLTGKKRMDIDKFELHCRQTEVIALCAAFLEKQGMVEIYPQIIQILNHDMFMDCIGCFMRNIPEEDSTAAMEMLRQYWGEEDVDKKIKRLLQKQAEEIKNLQAYTDKLVEYTKELRGIVDEKCWKFPYDRVPKGSRVIIYGAGAVGVDYVRQIRQTKWGEIVLWVDQEKSGIVLDEILISQSKEIVGTEYDMLIIAISKVEVKKNIRKQLEAMQVLPSVII